MENDWTTFYSTNKAYKVTLIKELLQTEKIEVREIVKNQTGFPVGDIDLYVLEENVTKAKELISKHPEL